MWRLILQWIQRIVRIGILEFLSSLSWKVWSGVATALILVGGLLIALSILLVSLIF